MNLDDKLYLVRFNTDKLSHIKIKNPGLCQKCDDKLCTRVCPAHVYEWDEAEQKLSVGYEGCLECGTCRVACPSQNIEWQYPRGDLAYPGKNG